jgi:hypothetical protein
MTSHVILQRELGKVSELTQFPFRIGHDVSDPFPDLENPSRKEGFFKFEEGLTSEISLDAGSLHQIW